MHEIQVCVPLFFSRLAIFGAYRPLRVLVGSLDRCGRVSCNIWRLLNRWSCFLAFLWREERQKTGGGGLEGGGRLLLWQVMWQRSEFLCEKNGMSMIGE